MSDIITTKKASLKLLLFTGLLLFVACGQTGELRLPEEPKPTEKKTEQAPNNSK